MLSLELGCLETLGQPLLGRLLDDPRSGEPDPGPRLGQDHVGRRRERGRYPAEGGICQDRDVGPGSLDVVREGDAGLRHLHERVDALEHPRPSRRRDYNERQLLSAGELDGSRDPLTDNAPHRTPDKPEVERGERHLPTPYGAGSAQDGVIEPSLCARLLQPLAVILEPQEIFGEDAPVSLLETARVGEKPYPLRRRERVVELAVGTDVEAGPEVLLVDGLPALLALGEDGVHRADAALGLGPAPRILPAFAEPVPDAYPPAFTTPESASRTSRSHPPARSAPPSSTSRMSLLPMMIPSASSAASTAAPAEPIPNPKATGASVLARTRLRGSTAPGGRMSRAPVTPATETQYTNPVAISPTREMRLSVEVGATSGQKATPAAAASSANRPASSTGRSGITSPETPAPAASCKNRSTPRAKITL